LSVSSLDQRPRLARRHNLDTEILLEQSRHFDEDRGQLACSASSATTPSATATSSSRSFKS
jgi:hypothetical protein